MAEETNTQLQGSKKLERIIRLAGLLFLVGGIGFAALFEFDIVALVIGGCLAILGLTTVYKPKAVRAVLLVMAESVPWIGG